MAVDSPCDDWVPYKDEKCIKIIDETLRTYDDAEKICNQQENSAILLIIRSNDEQGFLSNLLFNTHKVLENVWIGVKYTSNKFKWIDDSDLSFSNWADGSPRNETGYDCVQMMSDITSKGKWVNEPCGKKGLVVCQKMQNWSISRLQKILLDARKELKDYIEVTDKKLNNLQQNPVPIGFIYAQLPGQPEPKSLWPTTEWAHVSSEYAGLFFRVEGGDSAAFGETQAENSPRLNGIGSLGTILSENPIIGKSIEIVANNSWSPYIYTGADGDRNVNFRSLLFKVSSGEVRPRNKAMRIWKRIK